MPKREQQYPHQQARVRRIKQLLNASGVYLIQGGDAKHGEAFVPVEEITPPLDLPNRDEDDGR